VVSAPAAQAGSTTSVSDPAGDVASTPAPGFTPMGPPTWADLLSASFTVAKGNHLDATLQLADLPETSTVGTTWRVEGTVTTAGGRTKDLYAYIIGNGDTYASVGSKKCGYSNSFSAATNTVRIKVNFSPCVTGAAKVRLRGYALVKGARQVPNGADYLTVYADDTAYKTIRLK
jgi:hypothetical protein